MGTAQKQRKPVGVDYHPNWGNEIPSVWYASWPTPSPLHGTGSSKGKVSSKELIQQLKKLNKELRKQERLINECRRDQLESQPSIREQQNINMISDDPVDTPLVDRVFGVNGQWLKTNSQKDFAQASVELAKARSAVIEIKEKINLLLTSLEGE